ncbi:MAG: hypothetical protein UR31_C0021G0002 [Parcubacteria group bacterium GW2011_GWA2_33_14]|uniref:Uncharacterized protein n=1 Tax=Candidatus Staskawiczbacteria bacterium RIFCSPHIGHO2_02_FULL_33_16 TaxID=1802204 RepID=A0A1G2HXE8_9BACT|nr:MAG: hypothetical protein UR31_C0021G0002 [Parcubacteria group bacterium GW2011_GWA2_33_14]OGZ67226.1 MAG: hypothetical protein A3D34_00365 [Candidatus Staskawiczbacteria bacterium RIFCSPHIGHO2_02_FULL_33_16]OGZ70925.1 MAG: hypothetical protein A2980_02815 [Candidatus Staskawiczbacteria bacterium RIFCSPLOWO2_01_FULL_33_13]
MNKKIVLLYTLAVLLTFPVISLAIVFSDPPAGASFNIPDFLSTLVTIVWWVFLMIVLILYMAAGILFLTAQGDQGQLDKAKKAVIWGTVGVFVGVLAFSIVSLMRNTFNLV